jgi:integrase
MAKHPGITRNVANSGAVSWTVRWKDAVGTDDLGLTRWASRQETFATLREALDHQTLRRHRQRTGGYVTPSAETLAAYMRRWLRRKGREWATESTYYQREVSWRVHGLPRLGEIPLAKLSTADVRAAMDAMGDAGKAPATVANFYVCVRLALDDAVGDGLLATNPVRAIKTPARRAGGPPRHWSRDQAEAFLRAVRRDRDYPLWLLLVRTGLRIGEALVLRWSDLSLEAAEPEAIVSKTLTRTRTGGHKEKPGAKTAAGNRRVPLVPSVVAALRQHRVEQHARRLALGPAWHDNGFVFPGPHGKRRVHNSPSQRMRGLVERAGLPYLTPHGFRHTAATLAIGDGLPIHEVQKLLGHGSVAVLFATYVHASPGGTRRVAERLDALLSGGDGEGAEEGGVPGDDDGGDARQVGRR